MDTVATFVIDNFIKIATLAVLGILGIGAMVNRQRAQKKAHDDFVLASNKCDEDLKEMINNLTDKHHAMDKQIAELKSELKHSREYTGKTLETIEKSIAEVIRLQMGNS